MKPKPILIISFPNSMAGEGFDDYCDGIADSMPDYHVIFISHESTEWTFQCFYEKDFNHVKYEELKELIKNKFKA